MKPFAKPHLGHEDFQNVPDVYMRGNVHNMTEEQLQLCNQLGVHLKKMRDVFGTEELKLMLHKFIWQTSRDQFSGITCGNGKVISAQAQVDHYYCTKDCKEMAYSTLEIMEQNSDDPEQIDAKSLWKRIESYGGPKYGTMPALDFGRPPTKRKRTHDPDALEHAVKHAKYVQHLQDDTRPYKGNLDTWTVRPAMIRGAPVGGLEIVGVNDFQRMTTSMVAGVTRCQDGVNVIQTQNSYYTTLDVDKLPTWSNLAAVDGGRVKVNVGPSLFGSL